ncbi:UNVERIFIED_ORG: AraC-like DNA-binding protein [Gordonia westfalica J30]
MSRIFDVRTLPRHDRVSTWHEVIWRSYVPLDIDVDLDDPNEFSGTVATARVGDIRIATSSSGASHRIVRTRKLVSRGNESAVMIGRQVSGAGIVGQHRNRSVLDAGDFVLWDTSSPYEIRFGEDWAMQVLQVPRHRLGLSDEAIARLCGRAFRPSDHPFYRGVSQYLGAVADCEDDPTATDIVARSVDLFRTAADRLTGADSVTGPDDERRRRVLAVVDANLAHPALSVQWLARTCGMSTRSLHRLFAGTETTIGDEIRHRRMETIRSQLADPKHRHRTISAIARAWGFPDAPHFSREFTRRYGITPTEWRAGSLAACKPGPTAPATTTPRRAGSRDPRGSSR